jgi:hypothetical protein
VVGAVGEGAGAGELPLGARGLTPISISLTKTWTSMRRTMMTRMMTGPSTTRTVTMPAGSARSGAGAPQAVLLAAGAEAGGVVVAVGAPVLVLVEAGAGGAEEVLLLLLLLLVVRTATRTKTTRTMALQVAEQRSHAPSALCLTRMMTGEGI